MCTAYYLWFIACSILMTNANILNDFQEAQKLVEQFDYDNSADAVAQQRPAADLLWYDLGGGGGGSVGGSYYGGGSQATGAAAAILIGAEKRGGTPQLSSANMWFGPRLGRRKRRGGGGASFNGGLVQPVDGNAVGPAASQEAMAAGVTATAAAGQAIVTDLINNAPWVLVPIIDNSLFDQMKQNLRSGRSSSEDGGGEVSSSSRHMARSPPYSPPFSPRLGRQVSVARPQVPRLGRETLLYRRGARSALYQQNAALLRQQQQQQQQQQQHVASAATESTAAVATGRGQPA